MVHSDHNAAPSPTLTQLAVWHPDEVRRVLALDPDELDDSYAVSCLADSRPGERIAIYETGSDRRGIVAVADLIHPAVRQNAYGYVAPAIVHEVRATGRAALLTDPALRLLFATRPSRRRLGPAAGRALAALIIAPPAVAAPPHATWEDGDFDSDLGDGRRTWAAEREMQTELLARRYLLRRLGLAGGVVPEQRSIDGHCRYDLIVSGRRRIVELKLDADLNTLRQVDRYLLTLRVEQGQRYRGAIVFGRTATPAVRAKLRARGDVQLWQLHRWPTPRLTRVA